MKPSNPIVMYMVRGVYFPLFFFPMVACSVALSSLLVFVPIPKEWVDAIALGFQGLSVLLFVYSLWLARETSIAFSEDNCFFIEASWVAFKRSLMYLQFLPVVGQYMEARAQAKEGGSLTKSVDSRTRFD